jgi:predicted RNase H-like HicB family nuclease
LEDDRRWLAEVPQLPGVLVYGATRDEAMSRAQVLALRVIAERLEHGEASPEPISSIQSSVCCFVVYSEC